MTEAGRGLQGGEEASTVIGMRGDSSWNTEGETARDGNVDSPSTFEVTLVGVVLPVE